MIFARILGILMMIAGVVMFFFSNYISEQVAAGQQKINSAQSQVNMGKQLFGSNPYTKDVGQGLTNSAQKKINEGQQTVNEYTALADQLHTGGIIVAAVGVGLFVISFIGRKKKK